ncbi:ethanolamine ammonia-lyase subunit EutC [Aureimonas sp. ME7]|uniref:ethanolamine ammonia-lyase subunit EutC n=1 Tax=Aureimonas sp. ME7 TaxID=2744252 RepID=UPI0015F60EE2|nr:ethanolamine ammonia-lyase subunit EutC [Aureimonas sp. ME7]
MSDRDDGAPPERIAAPDLRRLTAARVALGHAGGGVPTGAHQRFLLDHARAREAVWTKVDWPAVRELLEGGGLTVAEAESLVRDRAEYLRRPDLGRRLSPEASARLSEAAEAPSDLCIVIADGLSATAVTLNAGPLAARVSAIAQARGWRLAPVVLAREARVALGDEAGAALRARIALVLVGERPGLSAADSLGAYLTFDPKPGTPDSRRNCISNIREGGLSIERAARQIEDLGARMLEEGRSGVALGRDGGRAIGSLPG